MLGQARDQRADQASFLDLDDPAGGLKKLNYDQPDD